MGVRRFIFCFCSVAILATTTLPNAHAGPYDKEIEDLQTQIDEVNSDIDDIKNDVKTEEQKMAWMTIQRNFIKKKIAGFVGVIILYFCVPFMF